MAAALLSRQEKPLTEQPEQPRRDNARKWCGCGLISEPRIFSAEDYAAGPFCRQPANVTEQAWLGNEEPRTNILLEAETAATHALKALENGELHAGIAFLQSALAFALNARHERDTTPTHIVLEGPQI